MTAPLGSATVPLSDVLAVWPQAIIAREIKASSVAGLQIRIRFSDNEL
jgi:hypothetical protein